jgi:uncharacterized phiE125 gp8 family phage protein
MTYIPTTPPKAETLAVAEARAHLRLDAADEDELVGGLIRVAREHLERTTGLCLITQRWRLLLDSICEDGVIQICKGPVQSIEKVTVYDAAGNAAAVSLAGLLLDGQRRPARLMLAAPVAPGRGINGIEVEFTAGFGASGADVPDTLKRAMLTHVAQMFTCRGVVSPDEQPALIPPGYDRLIAPYLMRSL